MFDEVLQVLVFVGDNILSVSRYLLFAFVSVGTIKALGLTEHLRSWLEARPRLAVATATIVGCFSPFCSCTVIPLVASMLRTGVPIGAVMAFWLTSPILDPSAFFLTAGEMGYKLATARLITALAIGCTAGWLTGLLHSRGFVNAELRIAEANAGSGCCATTSTDPGRGCCVGRSSKPLMARVQAPASLVTPETGWHRIGATLLAVTRSTAKEIRTAGPRILLWLSFAYVLEALFIRHLPMDAVHATLTSSGRWDVPIATALSIPLYVNNAGSVPLAGMAMEAGLSQGAALSFLVGGPITTLPAMFAVLGLVRLRLFLLYLMLGISGSLLAGFVYGLFA